MLPNRILGFLLPVAHAQYTLVDSYAPANFFSKFEFWTSVDPTNGYVQYVNQSVAEENKLIAATDTIYMGVDMTNVYDVWGPGRPSVRIQSINTYNRGLFVLDLNHMPWGCGTWPAWWTAGNLTNWPADGEIDIIEGVHTNSLNTNQAYTSDGCSIAGTGQTGVADDLNCSGGCGSTAGSYGSYGGDFNMGGGAYAMEWTSSFIRVWFFPRGSIPSSITTNAPDPSEFGTPMANFQGNCDIDTHFMNHQIIFDITFCGDWAGPAYKDSGCPMYQGLDSWDSCKYFVASSPDKFTDAFWDINYMNVYQQDDPYPHAVSSTVPSAASAHSDSIALGKNAGVTSLIPSISPVIPTTASTTTHAISASLEPFGFDQGTPLSTTTVGQAMSTSIGFSPAATQPCSPFTSYLGPWSGYRTGIGGAAGGKTMCENNAVENNATDYLYVHYRGDDGSPLGYWDCWYGGVQAQSVLCGRLGRRQAYTSSPNGARVADYQIYEQMGDGGLFGPGISSAGFPSNTQDALSPLQSDYSSGTQPYGVAPNDLPAVITVSIASTSDSSPSSIPDYYSNGANMPDAITASPTTLTVAPIIQPDYHSNDMAISSIPPIVIVPAETQTYAPIPTDIVNAPIIDQPNALPPYNAPLPKAQSNPLSPFQPNPFSPFEPNAPQPDARPDAGVVVIVTTWVVDTATAAVTVTLTRAQGGAFAATSVALAAASAVVTAAVAPTAESTVTETRFHTLTETRWFQAPGCVQR